MRFANVSPNRNSFSKTGALSCDLSSDTADTLTRVDMFLVPLLSQEGSRGELERALRFRKVGGSLPLWM